MILWPVLEVKIKLAVVEPLVTIAIVPESPGPTFVFCELLVSIVEFVTLYELTLVPATVTGIEPPLVLSVIVPDANKGLEPVISVHVRLVSEAKNGGFFRY